MDREGQARTDGARRVGAVPPARPAPAAVLIADADAPTRAGVRMSLERAGFEISAQAADRAAAVEAALRHRPALCVLDVDLPGGGVAAAAEIAAELPDTRIVMLTAALSDEQLMAAVGAGAVGYLSKDVDPERLPVALRGVLGGEAALPRILLPRMIEELRDRPRRRRRPRVAGDPGLTEREWDVLLLLRDGLRTAEVAERLGISAVTVRRHVGEVVRKLGVADRAAALRLLEEGREAR